MGYCCFPLKSSEVHLGSRQACENDGIELVEKNHQFMKTKLSYKMIKFATRK